jgi:hypothetical protein
MNARVEFLVSPVTSNLSSRIPPKEIRLENAQATRWLNQLERRIQAESPGSLLVRFYEDLSDACQLASWKRENVCFDVDQASIPKLVKWLASNNSENYAGIDHETLQEIVAVLIEPTA